jgi:hypothetical protein
MSQIAVSAGTDPVLSALQISKIHDVSDNEFTSELTESDVPPAPRIHYDQLFRNHNRAFYMESFGHSRSLALGFVRTIGAIGRCTIAIRYEISKKA